MAQLNAAVVRRKTTFSKKKKGTRFRSGLSPHAPDEIRARTIHHRHPFERSSGCCVVVVAVSFKLFRRVVSLPVYKGRRRRSGGENNQLWDNMELQPPPPPATAEGPHADNTAAPRTPSPVIRAAPPASPVAADQTYDGGRASTAPLRSEEEGDGGHATPLSTVPPPPPPFVLDNNSDGSSRSADDFFSTPHCRICLVGRPHGRKRHEAAADERGCVLTPPPAAATAQPEGDLQPPPFGLICLSCNCKARAVRLAVPTARP